MFGFGGLSEVVFILFLAMLIFGPEKLPEIGRMLAKGMAEVRKASNDLKRTLNAELAASEQEQAARRNLQAVPAPAHGALPASDQEPPPPMWPASTIPAIEPFPAAAPAASPAPPSEIPAAASGGEVGASDPSGASGEAAPSADAGQGAGAAHAAGDAAHGANAANAAAASEIGAVSPSGTPGSAPAAASSPLLAPYGEGRDQGDAEAAHAADAAVIAEPR